MKLQYIIPIFFLVIALAVGVHLQKEDTGVAPATAPYKKLPKEDRINLAMAQEVEMTKDPATNEVPRNRLMAAFKYAQDLRADVANRTPLANLNWVERGPNNVGGRTRAILVDANDATGNTIWAGSIGGGLWKSTNAGMAWAPVDDFLGNMMITTLVQDPTNANTMYFGTGEGYVFDNIGIRGFGIWKSTDGGGTWSQLSSTTGSAFHFVHKLAINSSGTVFACTLGGIHRSEDGGTTWTKVLGSGMFGATTNQGADLEIDANGNLFASLGIKWTTDGLYRSTNNGTSWTKLSSGLPTSGYGRIEIACAPSSADTVYALYSRSGPYSCSGIYRSDNGGTTWSSKPVPNVVGGIEFTNGQAFYDLICAVDPNDARRLFIGGLDILLSKNGGDSWTQISQWAGRPGYQNIHADQHAIVYQSGNSDKIWFGNDGGIYHTTNGSTDSPTIVPRKTGYNVTQFYAADLVQIADSTSFLAGAQDNGTQRYLSSGVNSTTRVTGGDGGFCHIDADNANVQISAYVFNDYWITKNAWATNTRYSGTVGNEKGRFINPTDYDSEANVLYGAHDPGKYSTFSNIGGTGSPTPGSHTIAAFGSSQVSCITVSPNVDDRVYFGLGNGTIVRVDNANSSSASGTAIYNGIGYASSIAIAEGNENHIIITYSSYGVVSVFETTNGGTTWTDIEGNLPDMPIRSVIFHPNEETQVLLGTELGVWTTEDIDGEDTEWSPNITGFANARVDMLQSRKSDNTVIAATHGRGLFSTVLAGPVEGHPDCETVINEFPYVESFESGFGNWVQSSEDDFDWSRISGPTPSGGTGPDGAEDGTFYVYMETSDPNFPDKDAILESPCFDLTGLEHPVLNFSHHQKGGGVGQLKVEASLNGTTWTTLSTFDESRDSWQNSAINLDDYKNATQLRLRFFGTSQYWEGDICIDHIQIFDNPNSTNCTILTLSILTDESPAEVGWEVKQGGIVVASRNHGYYTLSEHQYEEEICLSSGCYELIMKDSHGDGLCCGHGNGNYSLADADGMVLASGASYGEREISTFCVEAEAPSCPAIDFNNVSIISFDNTQDGSGSSFQVQDGGSTLFIQDNAWKAIASTYTITPNTVLRFDFRSTEQCEIHGIGFSPTAFANPSRHFKVYGTQNYWCLQDYDTYSGTDWKTFVIPVGTRYTGTFNYIYFAADNDANSGIGNSYFRNVRVYEGDCFGDEPIETLGSNIEDPLYQYAEYRAEPENVRAFPNPFRNQLQVEIPAQIGYADVWLVDMNGKVLQMIPLAEGQVTIGQGLNLTPGMYFIQVRAKDFEQNLKVVNIR